MTATPRSPRCSGRRTVSFTLCQSVLTFACELTWCRLLSSASLCLAWPLLLHFFPSSIGGVVVVHVLTTRGFFRPPAFPPVCCCDSLRCCLYTTPEWTSALLAGCRKTTPIWKCANENWPEAHILVIYLASTVSLYYVTTTFCSKTAGLIDSSRTDRLNGIYSFLQIHSFVLLLWRWEDNYHVMFVQ